MRPSSTPTGVPSGLVTAPINLFAAAGGQCITPSARLDRLTTSAASAFAKAVQQAARPLQANGTIVFGPQLVNAAIIKVDMILQDLVSETIPDIEVTQDTDKFEHFSMFDIFVDEGALDKGMKPLSGMTLLAKLLYSPLSKAIISCMSQEEESRYSGAVSEMKTDPQGNRMRIDLRSFLVVYYARMYDPNNEVKEKARSLRMLHNAKYDSKRDLSANLDYFERAYHRAQLLTLNAVSKESAIFYLEEFITSSSDPELKTYFERIRFPQGMVDVSNGTLTAPSQATLDQLFTQLRSYARAHPGTDKRGSAHHLQRDTRANTNALAATCTSGNKGTGNANRNNGKNGQKKQFKICEKCLWKYVPGGDHSCPTDRKCIFCQGDHSPGDCPEVDEAMKKAVSASRLKTANAHNRGNSSQANTNNSLGLPHVTRDEMVSPAVSYTPTEIPSRLMEMDTNDLKFLAIKDSGTNVDVLCDTSFFTELTALPEPITVGSVAGEHAMKLTHHGPVRCYIENDASGFRVLYENSLAFWSPHAEYNILDTPHVKMGGHGALFGTPRGTRICSVRSDGDVEVLVDLVLDVPKPPQAKGMIFAFVTPAGVGSVPAAINISRAVPGANIGEALTLAVRRAGSPGEAVVKILLKEKDKYNFLPSAGARPIDPVVALGTAKQQPSRPSRFNKHRTINKDDSIHVDVSGPHPPAPDFFDLYDGTDARYAVHVTALPSRTRSVYYAPDTTGPTMAAIVDKAMEVVGAGAKIFTSDNARCLTGKHVQAVLNKHGVRRKDSTVAGEHEGNAFAESNVSHTRRAAAKLAAQSRMPLSFCWPILFIIGALKLGHAPHADTGISSYEAKHGRPWNFGNDRCIGAMAYAHNPNRPHKTDPPASQGIYIGDASELFNKRGHIIFFPETGTFCITHHYRVDETKYPELSPRTWLSKLDENGEPITPDSTNDYVPPGPIRINDIDPVAFEPLQYTPFPAADIGRGGGDADDGITSHIVPRLDVGRGEDESIIASGPVIPIHTLDQLLQMDPNDMPNALTNAAHKKHKPGVPLTIKQALQSAASARWKHAIRKELQSLKDLGVFLELRHPDDIHSTCGVSPNSTQVISMDFTWAFKIKLDGTYRARIALRGFKSGPLPLNKTRHLALKIGVLRDMVMERFILDPKHVMSGDNLSDGMTKPYVPKDFMHYRALWLNINQKQRFVPRLHPPHKK